MCVCVCVWVWVCVHYLHINLRMIMNYLTKVLFSINIVNFTFSCVILSQHHDIIIEDRNNYLPSARPSRWTNAFKASLVSKC